MRDPNGEKVIGDRECAEIVRKKLRENSVNDFQLVNYEVLPIGEGNGFMGQYFTLKTTVACSKTPMETREYNFFTKIPPPTGSSMDEFNQENGSFMKELELYRTVFPEVLNGLEERSIPECFLALGNDIIVLEDMAESGYEMANKLIPFDLEHCLIVTKALAKFHAKSLIFEELNNTNLHDEFPHCMQESLWPLREGRGKRMFDSAIKGTVSLIDCIGSLDLLDQQARGKLKQKFTNLWFDHAKKLKPSTKFKNVLCHGDLWANNILFRYDEHGKPLACCLIDFQLARYNPPAHDIMCFLQFTTTRELRENHGQQLFKVYWEAMAGSLENAGLDASAVFPWDDFIDSINELRTMCMTHGILNIPLMLLEPTSAGKYFADPDRFENVIYVDRTPLICSQFHQVPQYRERMMEAILELYESA